MLGLTTASQAKSTEKLSSGYKINRAADDAAGLSISEKMRKQIRGLTQASSNAEDGVSAVQTAEGALTEVHDMLQRMNELAVKAANGTMSENDRDYVQNEVDQLVIEIDRVSTTTKFNEMYLLDGKAGTAATYDKAGAGTVLSSSTAFGLDATKLKNANGSTIVSLSADKTITVGTTSYTYHATVTANTTIDDTNFDNKEDFVTAVKKAAMGKDDSIKNISLDSSGNMKVDVFADTKDPLNISLQVGADTTAQNKIESTIGNLSARGLGINGLRVDGSDSSNADAAVDVISNAIQKVSTQRSALGAVQNRLEHTINNLDNIVENTTSAESQIRDTDMATEMVRYSNNNILAQAGQAMLAQSNQANQGVLSLLG
jgi:flagellin